jgi:hypothetical protein
LQFLHEPPSSFSILNEIFPGIAWILHHKFAA